VGVKHFYRKLVFIWKTLPGFRNAKFNERNLGENLGEWAERSRQATRLLDAVDTSLFTDITDFGCGRQTIRSLVAKHLTYIPVDRIKRSEDTILFDFNQKAWMRCGDIACALGLLEYLDSPQPFLRNLICNYKLIVFSYNFPTTRKRRVQNNWKDLLSREELEESIRTSGGRVIQQIEIGPNEFIFLMRGEKKP
jgi:hypothetical protein